MLKKQGNKNKSHIMRGNIRKIHHALKNSQNLGRGTFLKYGLQTLFENAKILVNSSFFCV